VGAIKEELRFGIDLGIGSCGWAVIARTGEEAGHIVDMGSWCFDVPETDKERKPKNQIRRSNRLLRRVVRRRRQRMQQLRRLFFTHGLLVSDDANSLSIPSLDSWELRARALDKRLEGRELAVALGAIAKRRGFKSLAKREKSNKASDESKMLSSIEATRELLGRYRTVGEMFARDPLFRDRRRNREGRYDRTVAREDLESEVSKIFAAQIRLGNPLVTDDLREKYHEIAFFQRPFQDSESLLGNCRFETDEKRASKFSPSFEKFRLLCRLVNLRLREGWTERSLTVDELAQILANLGKTKKLSAKNLRKILGLGKEISFAGIAADKEDNDIAVRSGAAMEGTVTLHQALGDELWSRLDEEQRDGIAHCLTFFETNATIITRLELLGLDGDVIAALKVALEQGSFGHFKGAADLSNKAMRKLIVHLAAGLRYDEACARVGYDHSASSPDRRNRAQVVNRQQLKELMEEVTDSINNPIAKKALLEALKQIYVLIQHYGLPGCICIELARDVGRSREERARIESGLNKTTAERERARAEIREMCGWPKDRPVDGDTLLRYRLWQEQNHRCLYSDKSIEPKSICAGDNKLQVDHILPWSRFGDDSFHNKTLCFAQENQDKRNDTPYEWLKERKGEKERWQKFSVAVEALSLKGMKKRNYLMIDAKQREEGFRERNLNDTRYATRILADAVRFFYPEGERGGKGERRRIYTRPGALTSLLRRAWGVESLKKTEDGSRRADDRHHALDAVVVAAVSEGEIQRLTKAFQKSKEEGRARLAYGIAEPWPGFRKDVYARFEAIDGMKRVVARPSRQRARGEGHAASVRQVRVRDGREIIFERKAVTALKIDGKTNDLARIKDPERNQHIVEAITAWVKNGRKGDDLPRTLSGIEIAKVTLQTTNKPGVDVRGGTADRGDMVRVDVFSKANKKGKNAWYLVPIYRHQIMDRKNWPLPPNQAIVAHKDIAEWPFMDSSYCFHLSLFSRCYVEVVKGDGEVIVGYFAGVDSANGSMRLLPHHDTRSQAEAKRFGVKSLLSINKYAVDRLGYLSRVKSEPRLWHGKICISADPPD